jgi:hypothetical protein
MNLFNFIALQEQSIVFITMKYFSNIRIKFFIRYLTKKNCPQTFRPKRSFIKSVPGAGSTLRAFRCTPTRVRRTRSSAEKMEVVGSNPGDQIFKE